MLDLAKAHRSIRSFLPKDIDDSLLRDLLLAGLRSSSAGNMQTWSVIVTRDKTIKRQLYRLHGEQAMILEAPILLTFCADVFRMREWLRVNNSRQSFDDLLGFLTGTVDAVIAARQLIYLLPDVHTIEYGPLTGLRFTHPRGWVVYLGVGDDMARKVQVLRAIEQQHLEGDKRQPALVDLRYPETPYYRFPDDESGG